MECRRSIVRNARAIIGPKDREILRVTASDLESVLDQLPAEAQAYFERLIQIARLALEESEN